MDPIPLRELCQRAELILLGRIEEPFDWDETHRAPAVLRVREVLHGNWPHATIAVHAPTAFLRYPSIVRDRQPNTRNGQPVIVFLRRDGHVWVPVGRHDGVRGFRDRRGLRAYCSRIEEWFAIDGIQDADLRRFRTAEWLVRCIEHPDTRFDGVFEFWPERFIPEAGLPAGRTDHLIWMRDAWRDRMLRAVIESDRVDYVDVVVLARLQAYADPRLDEFLLTTLASYREDISTSTLIPELMHLAALRSPSAAAMTYFNLHWFVDEEDAGGFRQYRWRLDVDSGSRRQQMLEEFLQLLQAYA